MLLGAISVLGAGSPSRAADLPIPCVAGSCGAAVPGFVGGGNANAVAAGNTLTIRQTSDKAILNWSSFDVSADGRVEFQQPDASSVALNRIFQASPSRIFGTVDANGQIYLINPNGLVFGRTAKVNTAGLVASSLNISDATFNAGLLAPEVLQNRRAALESDGRVGVIGVDGRPVLGADGKALPVRVVVESGATIATRGSGGRVLLAGQAVENSGRISAPDGQVVLAAGEKVYLQASGDPSLRGLLVEVDGGGEAANRLGGELSTPRGNVTLAGLAVNQEGRISATTSVSANGSVRLIARDSVRFESVSSGVALTATRTGRVEAGAKSVIDVRPDNDDTATAIDEQTQLPSRIEFFGRQVVMRGGASIAAPGGELRMTAARDASGGLVSDPESRIRIETDARIDLRGSVVDVPVTRNLVTAELRANELRDAPLQRDGLLRGQRIVVDARTGTPLADISGSIAAIQKGIAERTSAGGTAVLQSQGDLVVAAGVTMDVSGGQVNFTPGVIQTTQLIGSDGRIVDIGQADPNRLYAGLINPSSDLKYDRWGVVRSVAGPAIGRLDPGYVEGKSAGTLQFAAPTMVLGGDFKGATTIGPLQREPALTPSGGRFVVGLPGGQGLSVPDYFSPSVNLVRRAPTLVVGGDSPLPAPRTLDLPLDFATRGGFSRIEINSNGTVTLAESSPLTLTPGASLRINAQRVVLGSSITAPAGTVRATAERTAGVAGVPTARNGVLVGDGVAIDVRGLWINDPPSTDPTPLVNAATPLFRNGGTIDLGLAPQTPGGEFSLGASSALLAGGGAWRQSSGTVANGRGGRIALRAGPLDTRVDFGAGVVLDGFGVGGAAGGSFLVEAGRIEVRNGTQWADAQRFDPAAVDNSFLRLGTPLFRDLGFASVELVATGRKPLENGDDVLSVRRNVDITARVATRELDPASLERPAGGTIAAFSRVAALPDFARLPFALTLRAEPRDFLEPRRVGSVGFEAGSVVRLDPLSTLLASSAGSIVFGGSVLAPAGTVRANLGIPGAGLDAGYDPRIAITVSRDALIDVAGDVLVRPNDTGLQRGSVRPGGTISLVGSRGSIDLQSGSRLDVSGTSAVLDLAATDSAGTAPRRVASAAGSIELRATESIVVQGDLRAAAGRGDTGVAPGGSLTVRLSRGPGLGDPAFVGTYPSGPRVVRLVSDPFGVGTALPNGLAILGTAQVAAAGIDALRLESSGRVELDAGVNLQLARQLVIDSPALEVLGGGAAALSAPFVSIGNSVLGNPPTAPIAGTGRLDVTASLLELYGFSTLQRIRQATLSAADLRLRGVESPGQSRGALTIAGNLTLQAGRIAPSTLSEFTFTAVGGADERIRIESRNGSSGTPLSVGGALRFVARDIEQAGTVLAPFGQLSFETTRSLTFGAGSRTSVSAEGELLPFGAVQGDSWQYQLGGTPIEINAIPARAIRTAANTLTIAPGATLDLRGGGDLLAYEWLPGTGGSLDALAAGRTSGLYAVVPQLAGQFAPFDPQEFAGSDLKPGDSVVLAAGSGLAAGVYPLLPARYALLPGAFLVSAVPSIADPLPGSSTQLADGTPVVAGYRVSGPTGPGETRYTGYSVRPGTAARTLANYEDRKASEFFAARATRAELPRPDLPADAGSLSVVVRQAIDARGEVLTAAATGGRGAAIAIAAPRLRIEREIGAAVVEPGTARISTETLSRWNPGRLLLGGTRAASGAVEVVADEVMIGAGAQLAFDEILLVGASRLRLESGARLDSRATTAAATPLRGTSLTLTGATAPGAAVLGVSDLADVSVLRSGATSAAAATIAIDAGATVASARTLLVDAPGGGRLDGDLQGRGAAWTLASGRVRFGADDGAAALRVSPQLLAALDAAGAVRITANTVEFATPTRVGVSADGSRAALELLEIRAGSVANRGGGEVRLGARTVLLAGAIPSTLSPPIAGQGTLSIVAEELNLGAGNLALTGFARTSLVSTRTLDAIGDVNLNVAGPLDLTAARLSAAAGTQASIRSDGLLRVTGAAAAPSLAPADFGGGLTLAGADIDVAGAVVLPSGTLSLESPGAIRLRESAVLDVSGAVLSVADRAVGSSGGLIRLIAAGDIDLASGSQLRLDGAGTASAGRLQLVGGGTLRTAGSWSGRAAASDARGGSLTLDAARLADFSSVVARLTAGGFDDRLSLRVASGDLRLNAGATLTGRAIELVADGGTIQIDGTLNGLGGNERAEVGVFATGGVVLGAGGSILADSESGSGRGGRVTLASSGAGRVDLAPGSRVSLRGAAENGQLRIRAAATSNDVAVSRLAANFTGVDEIVLEPVLGFDLAAAPTAATLDTYRASAATYVGAATPTILARLGGTGTPRLAIEPGVDLLRTGDLSLPALSLNTWRFAGRPGAINVRATGNVSVLGSWSDGLRTVGTGTAARLDLLNEASSTLRWAAGARLSSANPLAISSATPGDLSLRPGVVLRTGTGDLRLAASRDVVFGGAGSAAYTIGLPGAPTLTFTQPIGSSATIPTRGGSVSIMAGRDVLGFAVSQSPSIWQPRQGRVGTAAFSQTLWGLDPGQFLWNVGTLGGGDLRIAAGRDARDLTAAVADAAIELVPEQLTRFRGGVLDVVADRDIGSLMAHVAQGDNRLRAGGALSRTRRTTGGADVGSLLSMQGGRIDVVARTGIALESVVTPTLLPQRQAAQGVPGVLPTTITFFSTYEPESAVRLQTAAGEASIDVSSGRLASFLTQPVVGGSVTVALSALPPNLTLRSFAGDVRLSGFVTLLPADRGQLDILAGRDVLSPQGMSLNMSDGSASAVPTPLRPAASAVDATAEIGRNASSLRHALDPLAAAIYAGRDAIGGFFGLPKQARVAAGRDIVDVSVIGQNASESSLTLVSAGRDLRYTRDAFTGRIEVGGPGRLDVLAGRNVDLGFSRGISTIGRLANPGIQSEEGADLTVIAGLSRALDASAFVDKVLATSKEGRYSVVKYIEILTGQAGIAFEAAATAFKQLSADLQRPLLLTGFFGELVASGREANADPAAGFERGYDAIDALLPGSRPSTVNATPTGPWDGDLTLAFSRIYTLGGGGIALLVPGGLLNVGLANPPTNLPIVRKPSDLGIVAQQSGDVRIFTGGDVLVNQSRVFTLRGGDIAIWSTLGDIDAGRGAKTAISAPPPSVLVDAAGNVSLDFSGAVAGSGIRAIVTDDAVTPGDVDLIAPAGSVNAGDAGIGAAGNLNVAAESVVGLDNIQVGGASTGVPAETSNLGASLSGVSSVSSAAGSAADSATSGPATDKAAPAPLADSALGWLDVFVEGFGQEVCKPSDAECLERNKNK